MATADKIAKETGLDMETAGKVAEAMLIPPALTDEQGIDNDTSLWLDNAHERMLTEAENISSARIAAYLLDELQDNEDSVDINYVIHAALLAGIAIGKGDYIG